MILIRNDSVNLEFNLNQNEPNDEFLFSDFDILESENNWLIKAYFEFYLKVLYFDIIIIKYLSSKFIYLLNFCRDLVSFSILLQMNNLEYNKLFWFFTNDDVQFETNFDFIWISINLLWN